MLQLHDAELILFLDRKAYIEQYMEDFDAVYWNEHRMTGEEVEEQFNKLAKSNMKIAVDEARDTEESTGQEDKDNTSGGVFIATDGGQRRSRSSENDSRQ